MSRNLHTRQTGLTLVELMVSMVLMLLVTLATVALYNVSNQSYKTVDANQELEDTARYAMDIIGQAVRNAGYQNRLGAKAVGVDESDAVFGLGSPIIWPLWGANNSGISSTTSATDYGASTNLNGLNASDTLVSRFFGSSNAATPAVADGTMVDCSGRAHPYPIGSLALGLSALYIATQDNEPELRCKSFNPATGLYSASSVARGVESMQVMYGYDSNADFIVDRWVSAQDVPAASWDKVSAVRVGLVIRGNPGSSQGQSATASENDLYPLGQNFTGASTEAGLKFTPPADGRLRKAFSSTFLIRNTLR